MADQRITRALAALRGDQHAEHRAALTGIAAYARASRRDDATVPELLEVLRHIEQHARAVLGPGMLPPGAVPALIPAPSRERDSAMSVERCVQLLFDPAGHIGRMRVDQLLTLAIGAEDADELLLNERLLPSRCVSSLDLPARSRLASAMRVRARA